MIEKFLKAKHWQIFMITFGLPIILEIIAMPFMIIGNNPMVIMKIMPIMMIFFIGGFFGWFWAIATGFQNKVPTGVKMKVKKFKVFFFIPLIYIILIFGFMGFAFGGILENGQQPSGGMIGGLVGIIVPLHLFSMFCIFYCLYFVSKTFKTVELQREVTFSDFAGEFFMIWFFPIGVWIVQPKINKMIENKESINARRHNTRYSQ
jgi:hypothetical protein